MNEVEYNGFYYRIDPEKKTAVLSRSNSSNPRFRQEQVLLDLVIPSSMYYNDEEYTVTGIDDSAFRECRAIESVDIPTSVFFILRSAFLHCRSLKKVIIRGEVEIPLFKGVFDGTNLSEIHWYGDIIKLYFFLKNMVSNESSFHPDYDAMTIHIRKDSDEAAVTKWLERPIRNHEKHLEVQFKIVKDL
jgi:hypothetical protein